MTNLQTRLDALPEYIKAPAMGSLPKYQVEANFDAALARLAEAREWIGKRHHHGCAVEIGDSCTCGRDALLKKLEVPK